MKMRAMGMIVPVVVCLVLGLVSPAMGAGVVDREKTINVGELKKALEDAVSPINRKMEESELKERFETVLTELGSEDVDKKRLVDGLESLQTEIDRFVADWDSVVNPIWDAQDSIAATADKVRGLLARCKQGGQSERAREMTAKYDRRLRNLATAIKNEPDARRRKRLKLVFGNVLSLKKLAVRLASVDISPAQKAVYAKTVRALSALEAQLTAAAFQLEKAHMVLVSQRGFCKEYVQIIRGLIEAEELAKMMGELGSDKAAVGNLGMSVNELKRMTSKFADMTGALMEKLAVSIETETAKVAASSGDPELDDAELDEEIDKYATQE